MRAIFKKDFSDYFRTPVGYVYLAVFYLLAGIFLYFGCLQSLYADISGIFMSLFTTSTYILPLLTMRLLSEERKQHTDQLLLTAPVSVSSIVLGKFLSAFAIYGIAAGILLVYALVFSAFSEFDWGIFFVAFLGMLLLGAAVIAIGLFISSLTENQIIAAVLTLATILFFVLADSLADLIPIVSIRTMVASMSFFERFYTFSRGILSVSSLVYFTSITLLFLYFTHFVLKQRNYKK